MIVRPFRGLRPSEDAARTLPSPPYDVMNTAEARALAEGNPDSFLRVIRPEIEFDDDASPYDAAVYARAAENLHSLRERGRLVRDEAPAYYLYRLNMGDHEQTGWVGASAVSDYREGRIKKHEHTRPEKERDRIRHAVAIGGCAGPVFLTYRAVPELNALMNGEAARAPDMDVMADDGVRHRIWVVAAAETVARVEALFAKIPATYIADGHHRAAASAQAAAAFAESREKTPGDDAPSGFFLTVLFPSEQLQVLDYNRLVRDLNGLEPDDLVRRIEATGFEVRPGYHGERPRNPETFGMYVDGRWFLLIPGPDLPKGATVAERLDVAILTREILQPVLGIGDPRTDARIEFVGGIRGMAELERRVDAGDHKVAFSLHPTPLEAVMEVADADEVMPPKSTWFEPKLRSGLVTMVWEGETL